MKKVFLSLTFIAVTLFANSSQEDQMYQNIKQMSLTTFDQQVTALKMIRDCVDKADSKREFASCMKISPMIGEITEDDDSMEWNDINKKEVLKDIDDGLKTMEGSKKCFETSSNMQSYDECIRKSGLDLQ